MAYWTLSDIFEEAGPVLRPLHGGFGLCSFHGLRKPTWFAHSFLHRLGPIELQTDDQQSWICRDGDRYQALIYNHTFLEQDAHDQEFFVRDIPSADAGTVTLEISGVTPGQKRVRSTRVGYRSNDLFAAWYDLGSPDHLSREEEAQLAAKTQGIPESDTTITVGTDGLFRHQLPLRSNDLIFLEIEPVVP
jgi:xylan 1,4-beta-xylosidase